MEVTTLLADFSFRLASQEEVLDILREKHLIALLAPKSRTLTELAGAIALRQPRYMLASYKQYHTLFRADDLGNNLCDVHIACPKASKVASRILVLGLCAWLFKLSELRPKTLMTSCPEGKIANMLRKVGAVEVKTLNGKVYFAATAESFNLK